MNKQTIYILVCAFLFGCNYTTQTAEADFMKVVREDFAKSSEEFNSKTLAWEEVIDILYQKADKNLKDGVFYADSMIESNRSLDKWNISELHTILGEFYYDHDSVDLALERFQLVKLLTFDSPRNKANIAGCYIKKGDLNEAMTLLKQATETNYDFTWLVGNLYEIEGQTNKAIEQYELLFQRDTLFYAYCKNRIDELKQSNPKLFTELHYKDRGKKTVLLLYGIDSTAESTTLGRIQMESRNRK